MIDFTCKFLCIAVASLNVLCPRSNTPGAKAQLMKQFCHDDAIVMHVDTVDTCKGHDGGPCEGWESVWDNKGNLVDWQYQTNGKLLRYLGGKGENEERSGGEVGEGSAFW